MLPTNNNFLNSLGYLTHLYLDFGASFVSSPQSMWLLMHFSPLTSNRHNFLLSYPIDAHDLSNENSQWTLHKHGSVYGFQPSTSQVQGQTNFGSCWKKWDITICYFFYSYIVREHIGTIRASLAKEKHHLELLVCLIQWRGNGTWHAILLLVTN